MPDCRYCGCLVEQHDPVYVAENDPDTEPQPFCNYACLTEYIDQEGLTTGTSCVWSPEGDAAD